MSTVTEPVAIINVLTFFWVSMWTLHALLSALKGQQHSILAPLGALLVFYALPIFLDVIIGQPKYYEQPGFAIASSDDGVAYLYCIYIALIPFYWWIFGRKISHAKNDAKLETYESLYTNRYWKAILHIALLLPGILLVFSPDPTAYLILGWREWYNRMHLSPEVIGFGTWLSRSTLISITASASLIYVRKRLSLSYLVFLLICMIFNVIIVSMRNVVAYIIVLWFYAFWKRGLLGGVRGFLTIIAAIVVFIWFNAFYLETYRGRSFDSLDFNEFYTGLRIDFGRDDAVKMTLYAELNLQSMQILEYRGQSLLYELFFFVPRSLWKEKPYAYADYFTAAMLRLPPPKLIADTGRGYMTTSWLEEAIANFSWLGLIIGPLVPAAVCRIGDGDKTGSIGRLLTPLIAVLFLVLHLPAFVPLFAIWLGAIILRI